MVLSLCLSFAANAVVVNGVVVVGERGCNKRDYIIINTNLGYVYAQPFRGSFDKGDVVSGDINSFGMKEVSVNSLSGSLWIDDFWLSKSRATQKCFGS